MKSRVLSIVAAFLMLPSAFADAQPGVAYLALDLNSGAPVAASGAAAGMRPSSPPNASIHDKAPRPRFGSVSRALRAATRLAPVPLEEYVGGVLTGEALPESGPAALEALAITIRTYALANRSRHAAEGFDLCDLTHCQVLRRPTRATERAAAATAGRVMRLNGEPAQVFYSASCGGHTERPSEVWPGGSNPSHLPSRRDDACEGGAKVDGAISARPICSNRSAR